MRNRRRGRGRGRGGGGGGWGGGGGGGWGRGRGRGRGGGRGGGGWDEGPDGPPQADIGPAPPAVILTFDELEALRLVDLEGMYQEEAASVLGISRRTLWSDLKNARRKVALALVNGQPIRIVGGSSVVHDEGYRRRPPYRPGPVSGDRRDEEEREE